MLHYHLVFNIRLWLSSNLPNYEPVPCSGHRVQGARHPQPSDGASYPPKAVSKPGVAGQQCHGADAVCRVHTGRQRRVSGELGIAGVVWGCFQNIPKSYVALLLISSRQG